MWCLCKGIGIYLNPEVINKNIWTYSQLENLYRSIDAYCTDLGMFFKLHVSFYFSTWPSIVSGAIFLRQFRLYILSFMFRFMFANICFEKNQNSKIHVMFIINITWNETWNNQVLPFVSLAFNMNHNIGFFSMKKSYVMIYLINHDMDPNSNINYRRKIPSVT